MRRVIVVGVILAALAGAIWTYRQVQRTEIADREPQNDQLSAEWLTRLYSQNPREVEAATQEVRRLGADALPVLQATLRNERSEAEELKAALKACGILGRTAAPIVDDVADVLPEPGLTAEAAVALSHMGPDALPPLKDALSHSDPIVRREALRSIGKLKERASLDSALVLRLLVERMSDRDPGVRAVAATYLGIIHEGAEQAVPVLIKGLADPDPEVRLASATAVGSFDPALAEPALPALRRAARDRNPDVAREAALAIVKLGKK